MVVYREPRAFVESNKEIKSVIIVIIACCWSPENIKQKILYQTYYLENIKVSSNAQKTQAKNKLKNNGENSPKIHKT